MLEIVLHGRPLHLWGELGLPDGFARADLPVFLIILPPVVEGMPVGVSQFGYGVRVRMVKLDERFNGKLPLLQAVHMGLLRPLFGPGLPPQSQLVKIGGSTRIEKSEPGLQGLAMNRIIRKPGSAPEYCSREHQRQRLKMP